METTDNRNKLKKEVTYLVPSENSLSHTRWNCKYHLVFIPKYRLKVIYGKPREDIGQILRRLCEIKDVEIVESHACMIISTCLFKYHPRFRYLISWDI